MELPSSTTPSQGLMGESLASTAMFFWVPKRYRRSKAHEFDVVVLHEIQHPVGRIAWGSPFK